MFQILLILFLHVIFSVKPLRNKVVIELALLCGKQYPKILNLLKRSENSKNFKIIIERGGCAIIQFKEKNKEYNIYLPFDMFDKTNTYYGFKDGEKIKITNYPGIEPLCCPKEYEYIICEDIEGMETIMFD